MLRTRTLRTRTSRTRTSRTRTSRARTRPVLFGAAALLALLSSSLHAETLPGGRTSSGAFPYAIKTATLPNGLRVAVVKTEHEGMFSLKEVVGVGSRDEVEPGHSGFAHFFEHMMFRGTKRFPADARSELLTGLGVNEGGSTTDDFTIYTLTGPASALPQVLELEGDRYQNLEYGVPAFKTEAKAVLGEYNKSFSSPAMTTWEALRGLAFDEHPYEHTVIGFKADIEKMPERYAYAQQFFKRFYTPDNTLLVIAGDVDADAVLALVEGRFGSWQGKRATTKARAEPAQKQARSVALTWPAPTQASAHVAWKVPSASEPRTEALLEVLSAYLFAESSPLVKGLVIEQQKVEGLDTWWRATRDPGLFPIHYRLREGATHDDVIARVQAALDEIAAAKVDAERFDDVKSHVRYALLMGLTSADNVAGAVGWTAGLDLDAGRVARVLEAVDALTPADLSALVKKSFAKERRTVVTLASNAQGGER